MAAGAQILAFPSRQAAPEAKRGPAKSVTALKKQFQNAVAAKTSENAEAAEAERYYHAVQWSQEDLKTLKDRRQPPVTFNRIKRKINTVCGILKKLNQEPKVYARNPQRAADDGAEIATKVIQYAMGWDWNDLTQEAARRCAIRGIAGVELVTVQGDRGDPEVSWDPTDMRDFFYDARSVKPDFSDARYLGTSRWVDLDEAQESFPDYAEELADYIENGPQSDWTRGDERNRIAWISKPERQVRIVDHWYCVGSTWHYCIYCGTTMLEYGESPYFNEKGQSVHKYEMFSCEIDQDGDRYAFFRDLKSPQDEVNHRRSKSLHTLNTRAVIADEGAVDDVEVARRELARSDGWVVKNPGKELLMQDAQTRAVYQGNMEMLQEAKSEIDTFGPNPGLIGTEIPAESGRAIQLLQAAGIAELGGFVLAWKNWKLRCYRKTWNVVQKYWTEDRWIRVTDDDNLAQFIRVNGWDQDPQTGQVVPINQLASLDVDIIFGESESDAVTAQADTLDTLVNLAKGGIQVPPTAIIELSPLPSSVKQRVLMEIAKAQQPNPIQQQQIMLQLQGMQAQIGELQSKAMLNEANAQKALAEANSPQGPTSQVDTPADLAKARLDLAQAAKIEAQVQAGLVDDRPSAEPGLFALNQAKARAEHAKADQLGHQDTLSAAEAERALMELFADQDRADRQDARDELLGQAQAAAAIQQARKTGLEADTIEQAPTGMLERPPPRTSVPSAGSR